MYGIDGVRRLTEYDLPWLPGYEGSKPVRVGNAASGQFQLDVYGEVMSALYGAHKRGLTGTPTGWTAVVEVMKFLEDAWQRPDDGIWEVRGGRRHFTHSKVMAWVAVDRFVRWIDEFGAGGEEGRRMRAAHGRAGRADPRRGLRAGLQPQRRRVHAVVRQHEPRRERSRHPARRVSARQRSPGEGHGGGGREGLAARRLRAPLRHRARDRRPARYGGRVPRLQLLAGGQLRLHGTTEGGRGAVRAPAVAAQSPRPPVGGVGPDTQAPDQQLPTGVLAPRADHDRADHRGGVAEPRLVAGASPRSTRSTPDGRRRSVTCRRAACRLRSSSDRDRACAASRRRRRRARWRDRSSSRGCPPPRRAGGASSP